MSGTPLLLASASPRRAALLRQVGLDFGIVEPRADEEVDADLAPETAVLEVARRKVDAVAARDGWVLGADTMGVTPDGARFGKPQDDADAVAMLTALAGRTHRVLTGVVVRRARDGARFETVEETRVTFVPLSREQVEAYVATGEPEGKAGAYAIQGIAGAFVARVEGDPANVVGLPLRASVALLHDAEYPLPAALQPHPS